MEPDSSSPASICLTIPPIFPFIASLPSVPPPQSLIRGDSPLAVTLLYFPLLRPLTLSLCVPPSGPPVLQGHVGRIEEHIGVVLVLVAEVAQARLRVAHFLGVVLSDPGPVAQPRLQRQLGKGGERQSVRN